MYHILIKVFKSIIRNSYVKIKRAFYIITGKVPWGIGYSDYKNNYIKNVLDSGEISSFDNLTLPSGYGYKLDERVVEYPWFFSRLDKNIHRILDAGSVLNFEMILDGNQLRDKDLYIVTLNNEKNPITEITPSYIYEDLRSTCFKDNFFDAICCMSTLEHIGMDNTQIYTDDLSKKEHKKSSFIETIKEFHRILDKDGILYVTVPFGSYKDFGWMQIFNSSMIEQIIETFSPSSVEKVFFKYDNNQWNVAIETECINSGYFDIHTQKKYKNGPVAAECVACIKMTK